MKESILNIRGEIKLGSFERSRDVSNLIQKKKNNDVLLPLNLDIALP
jgi:hypothetical protein